MRFESAPWVSTALGPDGALAFSRMRTALVFEPDGRVNHLTEALDYTGRVTRCDVLPGRVVSVREGDRIELEVGDTGRDLGLRISAQRVDDDLVCHVLSLAQGTARSELLTLHGDARPFVVGPLPRRPARPPPLPQEVLLSFPHQGAIELEVQAASDADNEVAFERLNRQLRQHAGEASVLHLRQFPDAERRFMRELLSGPLDALHQLASAALDGRENTQVCALQRPTGPGGPWRITLTGTAGPTVQFKLNGWSVVDQKVV